MFGGKLGIWIAGLALLFMVHLMDENKNLHEKVKIADGKVIDYNAVKAQNVKYAEANTKLQAAVDAARDNEPKIVAAWAASVEQVKARYANVGKSQGADAPLAPVLADTLRELRGVAAEKSASADPRSYGPDPYIRTDRPAELQG